MTQIESELESGYQGVENPAVPFSIASGQQTSSIIKCGGFTLCGILLPPAFIGTTLTFLASVDGISFFPVVNTYAGTPLSYVVSQGEFVAINPVDFYGINYLQVKSGSSESALRNCFASLKGF
jgi:hypothetical protein